MIDITIAISFKINMFSNLLNNIERERSAKVFPPLPISFLSSPSRIPFFNNDRMPLLNDSDIMR